jgi:O-antigen ligase
MPDAAAGQLPPSSGLDQLAAGILILFGIITLVRRRRVVSFVLRSSWPILLYFAFCLLSLLWSDFPGWGFKRWIRALGDLSMMIVVVTDAQPTAALRQFLSRVGFVLLIISVLLIKYYHNLGQTYDTYGLQMNVGVTSNKNSLGAITFVVALGTLWQLLELLRDPKLPKRPRRLLAQSALLYFAISLLYTAHSATSGTCFALGAGIMLAIALPMLRHRPAAVHALVLVILLGGGLTALVGGSGEAAKALGRNSDLTGRTEVWKSVIPMVPNPIVGAGFETFWLGPRAEALVHLFHSFLNESHNGYIEVYLNLGWFGVALIALILAQGYKRAVGAFRRNSTFGGLFIAYIVTATTYNITEAGFRMLSPAWLFLVLSVVAPGRVPPSVRARRKDPRISLTPPCSGELAPSTSA